MEKKYILSRGERWRKSIYYVGERDAEETKQDREKGKEKRRRLNLTE